MEYVLALVIVVAVASIGFAIDNRRRIDNLKHIVSAVTTISSENMEILAGTRQTVKSALDLQSDLARKVVELEALYNKLKEENTEDDNR